MPTAGVRSVVASMHSGGAGGHRAPMSWLAAAWWISFLVTILVLPVGLIRLVAIGSGGFEPSRTMRVSAWFAVGLGAVGLVATVIFTAVVLS